MQALFDKDSNLVGWRSDTNVFDPGMNWVAFIKNGHVWRASDSEWVGPINGGSLLDRTGKTFAWAGNGPENIGLRPLTPLTPLRPLQPLTPLTPLAPLRPLTRLTPMGGWSAQGFADLF